MTDGILTDQNLNVGEKPIVNTMALQETEKLLKQSEVDRIVHARMTEAMSKGEQMGYRKAMDEAKANQSPIHNQSVQTMGGMQTYSPEQIKQMVAEETKRQNDELHRQAYVNNVATSFNQKLEAAKTKYSDFEDTIAPLRNDLGNPAMATVVLMANQMDNTADIMYDLAKNPQKVANLVTLAHTSPTLAQRQMQELSNSIKQNQVSSPHPVKEPLSQIRPSAIGTDNGPMTVSDYRKLFK